MSDTKARISGLPAVLILVAIAAFGLWRRASMKASLNDEAAAELKGWLAARYAAEALGKHTRGGTIDASELDREALDEVLRSGQVEIVSIDAKGDPDDVIVRVEIRIAGEEPPDGKSIRYYRMTHSLATGWYVRRETGKWSYRLKLF
ncbi:MAG: hypothetical protein GF331_16605 [Chitinivibrionales bacterium]|nr:hypothetical protein [Chitinivibrionales bacterium]